MERWVLIESARSERWCKMLSEDTVLIVPTKPGHFGMIWEISPWSVLEECEI